MPGQQPLSGGHGVVGFVGEGWERQRARESEGETETTGYEPSHVAQTAVAGEGVPGQQPLH